MHCLIWSQQVRTKPLNILILNKHLEGRNLSRSSWKSIFSSFLHLVLRTRAERLFAVSTVSSTTRFLLLPFFTLSFKAASRAVGWRAMTSSGSYMLENKCWNALEFKFFTTTGILRFKKVCHFKWVCKIYRVVVFSGVCMNTFIKYTIVQMFVVCCFSHVFIYLIKNTIKNVIL